jgi:hypothetical protein
MTDATVQSGVAPRDGIHWGRVLIGAVLIEALLIALAVPLLGFVDNPLAPGAQGSGDFTIFFVSVALACFAAGALFGWWVARPLSSKLALHGALTGIAATAIYLGICSIPPTTVPAVIAAYGPFWFFTANGLRIAGSILGAVFTSSTPQVSR